MGFFRCTGCKPVCRVPLYRVRRLFAAALVPAVPADGGSACGGAGCSGVDVPENGRQNHRPAKAGGGTGSRTEKRRRVREINTATPLQKKLFLQGRRSFYTLLFILWVIQSFEHHHAQNCKAGTQHKTHCPHRHTEQNAHSNTEQDTRDLTFLHFTALPFRTRPPTAAKRGSTAPERSVQCPAEPVAERPAAEGSGPGRPHWRTRQTPSEPQPGRP